MRTRLIGLGNTILTDDGVGIYVARAVRQRLSERPDAPEVDVVEAETAGFALLELLQGWERVIVVDALQLDGLQPGEIVRIDPGDLRTSLRLRSIHEIDLPTALALGRELGHPMPDEVLIVAVQAADLRTFGEELTAPVAAALPLAVEEILRLLCPASPDD
jgi:hydrogenase maturation protease